MREGAVSMRGARPRRPPCYERTGDYWTATRTSVLTNDAGGSSCMMSDRGEYRITYDPSCRSMAWTLVSDTCTARATALDSAVFTRL